MVPVISLALLSACVDEGTWTRADMDSRATVERKAVDMGDCRQAAAAVSPIPNMPPSAPSGYDVSGTYTRPGQIPGSFNASVEPRRTTTDAFNDSYARAAAMSAARGARLMQTELFAGCMRGRGWQWG